MVGDRGVDTKTESWLSIYNSADSVPALQDSCQLRRGQTFQWLCLLKKFVVFFLLMVDF